MITCTSAVQGLFQASHRQVMRITLSSDAVSASTVYALLSDNTEVALTNLVMSDNTEITDSWILYKNYIQSASDDIEINESDILVGGFVLDNYSMSTDRIEIGSAISAEFALTLQNYDGRFDNILFEAQEMHVELGVKDWSTNDAISWISLGYFIPDKQPKRRTSLKVTALDRMVLFDTQVDWSTFTFPCTLQSMIQQTCTACGVTLATDLTTLPNYNYSITYSPETTVNYRDIIRWGAFLTGTCAQMDENGELVFRWYTDSGVTITSANRYSHEIEESDITLTGLYYRAESGLEYLQGTADYALEYSDCQILQNNVETALANIWTAVSGFAYRPFEAVIQSSPFLQPLDMITFRDKDGNDQTCIISKITYTGNQSTPVSGPGETATQVSYAGLNGLTSEQQTQVDDARRQATNYLAADASGIMVADMTDGTRYTPSTVPTGTKNTFIDSDSFDVRDGTTVLASFGTTSQIGQDDENHLNIDSSGIQGVNNDGDTVFNISMLGVDTNAVRVMPLGFSLGVSQNGLIVRRISYTIPSGTGEIRYRYSLKLVYNDGSGGSLSGVATFTRGTSGTATVSDTDYTISLAYSQTQFGTNVIETLTVNMSCIPDTTSTPYVTQCTITIEAIEIDYITRAPAYSLGIRSGNVGPYSAIVGDNLTADYEYQFACGKYNESNPMYAFMVGNGESGSTSNAFVVTRTGNILLSLDGTSSDSTDAELYDAIVALGWESEVIV